MNGLYGCDINCSPSETAFPVPLKRFKMKPSYKYDKEKDIHQSLFV